MIRIIFIVGREGKWYGGGGNISHRCNTVENSGWLENRRKSVTLLMAWLRVLCNSVHPWKEKRKKKKILSKKEKIPPKKVFPSYVIYVVGSRFFPLVLYVILVYYVNYIFFFPFRVSRVSNY